MAKAKKKRRAKWEWLRYRKGDHAHNLLCAAQRWIHANGGTALVLGSIGVMDENNPFVPGSKGKYQVCVGALGIKPKRLLEKEK
jgi:hypothetical protein